MKTKLRIGDREGVNVVFIRTEENKVTTFPALDSIIDLKIAIKLNFLP
jgi:hypothetical protein